MAGLLLSTRGFGMDRRTFIGRVASGALAAPLDAFAQAQRAKVYRVGIIHEGGYFSVVVDGLKNGLKDLGLAEGKNYVLEIRDLKGDRNASEEAARSLEREKVDLIYAIATSVTILVKRATVGVPIVFVLGGDPVAEALADSYAKPGGRLTGVAYLSSDLTGKRLEILKEILPRLRKVVMFYDPSNEVAFRSAKLAREAAQQLEIELVERRVASAAELQTALRALEAKDADAYFQSNDAMVTSQARFIINTARAKKLPTMFQEPNLAEQGALAGYGVNFYEIGRLSAKYVQRILAGIGPQNQAVEMFSRFELAVNRKTARELGLTIPQAVLLRADKVIE